MPTSTGQQQQKTSTIRIMGTPRVNNFKYNTLEGNTLSHFVCSLTHSLLGVNMIALLVLFFYLTSMQIIHACNSLSLPSYFLPCLLCCMRTYIYSHLIIMTSPPFSLVQPPYIYNISSSPQYISCRSLLHMCSSPHAHKHINCLQT